MTANFSIGLRAQWISQSFTETSPRLVGGSNVLTNTSFSENLTTWSLGPKFGLDTNWLLGYGIKVLANIATSVLYTSYNAGTTTHLELNGSFANGTGSDLHNYGTLRPVTEAFLGLGWGSYLWNDNFHMDVSIGYDFDVYWDFNMQYATISQTVGNMYLHGMNIQARFDF